MKHISIQSDSSPRTKGVREQSDWGKGGYRDLFADFQSKDCHEIRGCCGTLSGDAGKGGAPIKKHIELVTERRVQNPGVG